ncbi:hypothetical protein ACFL04_00845 [Patescibacteria group bacterium]
MVFIWQVLSPIDIKITFCYAFLPNIDYRLSFLYPGEMVTMTTVETPEAKKFRVLQAVEEVVKADIKSGRIMVLNAAHSPEYLLLEDNVILVGTLLGGAAHQAQQSDSGTPMPEAEQLSRLYSEFIGLMNASLS